MIEEKLQTACVLRAIRFVSCVNLVRLEVWGLARCLYRSATVPAIDAHPKGKAQLQFTRKTWPPAIKKIFQNNIVSVRSNIDFKNYQDIL